MHLVSCKMEMKAISFVVALRAPKSLNALLIMIYSLYEITLFHFEWRHSNGITLYFCFMYSFDLVSFFFCIVNILEGNRFSALWSLLLKLCLALNFVDLFVYWNWCALNILSITINRNQVTCHFISIPSSSYKIIQLTSGASSVLHVNALYRKLNYNRLWRNHYHQSLDGAKKTLGNRI